MYHDYFLTNRALQIQRLCERSEGNRIAIPDRQSRAGMERPLANLFKSLDKIVKLPVGDRQAKGFLTKLKLPSALAVWDRNKDKADSPKPLLSQAQRDLLIEFERHLVRVRLDDDATSARLGTAIFNSLLGDHAYFNSLKPLPHYAEDFAYELLFPTWVNLNTVMLQPVSDGDQPRFSADQQRTIIRFLDEWTAVARSSEAKLVAMLTLIANRLEPPESHGLMQCLIDLCFDHEGRGTSHRVDRLWQLQEGCEAASEVICAIIDFVVVNSCLYSSSSHNRFPISESPVNRVDLPRSLVDALKSLQDDADRSEDYRQLLSLCRAIIRDAAGFDSELEALLNRHEEQLPELLGLVTRGTENIEAIPPLVQGIVAEVAAREVDDRDHVNIKRIQPFCDYLATRMDGFARPTVVFFHAEFVRKAPNRKALLGCADTAGKRSQLAAQLLKIAKGTRNLERFLNLLSVAAVVDPRFDQQQLKGIQSSIAVLQFAQMDQTIGRNELSDLEIDIRDNLPDSLPLLATPLQAALQKDERLAKLYLALNEEAQILQHSGTVSNFGVTRASFSHLSRIADDED